MYAKYFIIYMKKCEDRSTTEEGGLWRSLRYLPHCQLLEIRHLSSQKNSFLEMLKVKYIPQTL